MPIVPSNINLTGTGQSPLSSQASPENLLMAAAEMDRMGRFDQASAPKPKMQKNRPMKVMK